MQNHDAYGISILDRWHRMVWESSYLPALVRLHALQPTPGICISNSDHMHVQCYQDSSCKLYLSQINPQCGGVHAATRVRSKRKVTSAAPNAVLSGRVGARYIKGSCPLRGVSRAQMVRGQRRAEWM